MLVQNSLDPNNYGSTKVWVQILCPNKMCRSGSNKIWSKNILIKRNHGFQKLYPKIFVKIGSVTSEIFTIWANFARTNVSWTNVTMAVDIEGHRNYLQSLVRIGSVTAEILLIWTNVARTNVAWEKCDCDNWHLLKRVPVTLGTYLESLVRIGPVTADILLIWTNVARTNVAWTNVTVTVYIC